MYKAIAIILVLVVVAVLTSLAGLIPAGAEEEPTIQREFPIDFEVVHNYNFDVTNSRGQPITGWIAGPIKRGMATELEMGLANHGEAVTVEILAPGSYTSVEPSIIFLGVGSSASFTCRIDVPLNAGLGAQIRSLQFWIDNQAN